MSSCARPAEFLAARASSALARLQLRRRASTDRPRSALGDDAVTVGSFDFAESALLAEIYSQALEAGGYRRASGLRARAPRVRRPRARPGLVELVPEYAGTALQFLSLGPTAPHGRRPTTHAASRWARARRRITSSAPAPAQDANTFVVTRETADDERPAAASATSPRRTPSSPSAARPSARRGRCAWSGCERGLRPKFKEFVALDAGGPVTRQALRNGDVDVALLFTTDPAIGGCRLRRARRRPGPAAGRERHAARPRTRSSTAWATASSDVIDAVSARPDHRRAARR